MDQILFQKAAAMSARDEGRQNKGQVGHGEGRKGEQQGDIWVLVTKLKSSINGYSHQMFSTR